VSQFLESECILGWFGWVNLWLLNILRKAVLNVLKLYRDKHEPKQSMVNIARKCLHDTDMLLEVLAKFAD